MEKLTAIAGPADALFWLFFMGLQDIQKKSISVRALILMTASGVVFAVLETREKNTGAILLSLLLRVLPGLVMLLFSFFLKGAVGSADGWAAAALGLFAGAAGAVESLMYGLLFCGLAGLLLLALKKKRRSDALAFLPFLAGGYLMSLLL